MDDSTVLADAPKEQRSESAPAGAFLPWDDAEFLLDPYPWFARVQEEAPVFLDPSGMYVVTRYADVMAYGKHPAMSVEPGWDQAGPWALARETIIGRDDPDHTRLRRHTTSWFTPKLVKEWVTTTAEVTRGILDELDDGVVDGWHQLAAIPTHRTMCRILGLPDHDVESVQVSMEQAMPMLRVHTRPGELEMAEAAFEFIIERVEGFIATKQETPGDGLADALLAAWGRGELSRQEMLATIAMFYALGHMDVGYSIASGLHQLARHPAVFDAFRDDAGLRDRIVNEVVRLDAPELSFYRTTTEAITIGGAAIPAGATVRFMIGAANRDSRIFDNPHDFDFLRPMDRSRNLSFGLGPHTCAGQVISRAEIRTVFEVIAERYRRIELAGEVVMDNNDFSRHYKRLPLRLVP